MSIAARKIYEESRDPHRFRRGPNRRAGYRRRVPLCSAHACRSSSFQRFRAPTVPARCGCRIPIRAERAVIIDLWSRTAGGIILGKWAGVCRRSLSERLLPRSIKLDSSTEMKTVRRVNGDTLPRPSFKNAVRPVSRSLAPLVLMATAARRDAPFNVESTLRNLSCFARFIFISNIVSDHFPSGNCVGSERIFIV